MSVAVVSDVAVTLGRPITSQTEVDQVSQWLDDAEMQIRLRLGDVSLLDQQALVYVEKEAVALKVLNPEGKQSEGIDDYTYRRFDANARGQVFITDDWWELLSPSRVAGAFTISPTGSAGTGCYDTRRPVW